MSQLYPRNIPDPKQRGVVTRYGAPSAFDQAATIKKAMADPGVQTWATSKSLSSDDLKNLTAALTAALL